MTDSGNDIGYTPDVAEVESVSNDAEILSSEILDIINLKGKVSEGGPGVSLCEGKDYGKFFVIRHPWSIWGVPVEDMEEAMTRLKGELPKNGWKVTSYGPDRSKAKSLTLYADSTKKKFTAQIKLLDRRGRSTDPSGIMVSLVSACFQVPKGQRVKEY